MSASGGMSGVTPTKEEVDELRSTVTDMKENCAELSRRMLEKLQEGTWSTEEREKVSEATESVLKLFLVLSEMERSMARMPSPE